MLLYYFNSYGLIYIFIITRTVAIDANCFTMTLGSDLYAAPQEVEVQTGRFGSLAGRFGSLAGRFGSLAG
jgi:hypothetical protein